jgi:hypothetical protein
MGKRTDAQCADAQGKFGGAICMARRIVGSTGELYKFFRRLVVTTGYRSLSYGDSLSITSSGEMRNLLKYGLPQNWPALTIDRLWVSAC